MAKYTCIKDNIATIFSQISNDLEKYDVQIVIHTSPKSPMIEKVKEDINRTCNHYKQAAKKYIECEQFENELEILRTDLLCQINRYKGLPDHVIKSSGVKMCDRINKLYTDFVIQVKSKLKPIDNITYNVSNCLEHTSNGFLFRLS